MTDPEYGQWVKHHAALFWMQSDHDVDLFRVWKQSLIGYILAELIEASQHIAADPDKSKLFRTAHLGLIRSRIQSRRHERRRAEFAELDRKQWDDQCKMCLNCGIVFVPNPHCIVDGAWVHPWYSLAVACRCHRGAGRFNAVNAKLAERNKTIRLDDLQTYEAVHPEWMRFVADRQAAWKAERGAQWHAVQADAKSPIRRENVVKSLALQLEEKTVAALGDASED